MNYEEYTLIVVISMILSYRMDILFINIKPVNNESPAVSSPDVVTFIENEELQPLSSLNISDDDQFCQLYGNVLMSADVELYDYKADEVLTVSSLKYTSCIIKSVSLSIYRSFLGHG